jgi:predicted ATPase
MPADNEDESYHEASFLFYRVAELLRAIFGSFTYLGPLREEPSRRYIYEDEIVEIGVKGENAAYIYMAEGKKILKNHYFYNSEFDTFEKKESVSLHESVNLWFSVMGIHEFDASSESEIIRLLLNSSKDSDTQVNIADVGFGVSQIFPIVLEGLRMNPGQTLLLEQPEIHLHPRMQMQLADYIISLILAGKKVIIETHSDHIVNRLVRRMVEDKSGKLAKMMGIYFVSQGDNGSIVEEVTLSPKKGIVNWPEEFFDQAAIEQQRIMSALIENRKGG